MTTFNFTVRAVDERGAYADRDFSIKVRNTIVDRYVAMSMNGHLYTSPDAETWTQRINQGFTTTDYSYANNVVFGNGIWLAPYDKDNYRTSIDGVNWNAVAMPGPVSPTGTYLTAIQSIPNFTFVNGQFAMLKWESIGSYLGRRLYTSYDGITWESKAIINMNVAVNSSIYSTVYNNPPTYGGGKWMITCGLNNSDVVWVSSDDGATWKSANTKVINLQNVYYFNGLYFAISSSTMDITTSLDGFSWIIQPIVKETHVGFSKLLYGNGRIVAIPHRNNVGSTVGASTNFVMTSLEGTTWTKVGLPITPISSATSGPNRASAIYHNGLFFISWSRTPQALTTGLLYSSNGIAWSSVPTNRFVGYATGFHSIGGIGQD